MPFDPSPWPVVVVGSGIGGLACAAALARLGRRALVLERHDVAGGLTHVFSRDGWDWDVGVHYLGQCGPGQPMRRVLDWLAPDAIDFAPMGAVTDVVHLADGSRVELARPRAAFEQGLVEAFPHARAQVEAFMAALDEARKVASVPFLRHAMPHPVGSAIAWLRKQGVERWWQRTLAQVLDETVQDRRLRQVLSAQWGDHGSPPSRAAFAMHAMIVDHYLDGAWYPVGGAGAFARALVPVIEQAGGEVRTGAAVARLLVRDGRVAGVECADGTRVEAEHVVSDAGVHATVAPLPPPQALAPAALEWIERVRSLAPSVCHVGLYLGLEGAVEASGATRANHWFYADDDIESIWRDPFDQAEPPATFVSFPSLKDPSRARDPARAARHTAEVAAWTDWSLFEPWADSRWRQRPEDYEALKDTMLRALRAQFERRFPALAPLVRRAELSTPLTTAHFVGRARGAIYGLDASPARFASDALDVRTPVPGLLLAGQDVGSPGVMGAMMGGLLAAGALDRRALAHL